MYNPWISVVIIARFGPRAWSDLIYWSVEKENEVTSSGRIRIGGVCLNAKAVSPVLVSCGPDKHPCIPKKVHRFSSPPAVKVTATGRLAPTHCFSW